MKVAKKKDDRFSDVGRRIGNVIKIAFGQSKLLRDPFAGTVHFLIFWGFMLFLFAVIETIIQGFYSPFNLSFLGPDLFCDNYYSGCFWSACNSRSYYCTFKEICI